jgi:hypothetical protein
MVERLVEIMVENMVEIMVEDMVEDMVEIMVGKQNYFRFAVAGGEGEDQDSGGEQYKQ